MLYWLQTEAPRADGGTGFPGLRLRGDVTGTADGLAQAPYIRESRRIRAEYTVVEQDLSLAVRGDAGRRAATRDSVGVGMYRIDLHPSTGGDNYIDVGLVPVRDPARRADPAADARTCCRPARTSAPPTSPTAATGCTRSSGTSARSPGLLAAFCLDRRAHAPARCRRQPRPARRLPGPAHRDGRRAALARRHGLLREHTTEEEHHVDTKPTRPRSPPLGPRRSCWPRAVSGSDARATAARSTLRMTIWTSNEAHLKLFNEIADGVQAEPSRSHGIKFDPLPFESYTTTLTTQIAGGNAARPGLGPRERRARLRHLGRPGAADDTLKKTDGYDVDDLIPSRDRAVDRATASSTRYPFSTSPFGVFVNNDLIKAAGAEEPGRADRSRRVDLGERHRRRLGGARPRPARPAWWSATSTTRAGTTWPPSGAAGAPQPWSADGKTCTFNSPPMVDAMTVPAQGASSTTRRMPGPGDDGRLLRRRRRR